MPVVSVSAMELGSNMRKWFQGWHEASATVVGRTALFKPAHKSKTERELEAIVRSKNGVPATLPHIAPFVNDADLMTPIYVRVRGGATTSAATLCKINGYVAPTELYISAKTKLLSALNRHVVIYKGLPSTAVAGSFARIYSNGRAERIPASLQESPLFFSALRLSSDVIQSANPQWRDPRSRAETSKQFTAAVRELAETVPLAIARG